MPTLAATIKARLEALPPDALPLHKATTQGGIVGDQPISVTVLSASEASGAIKARVGVFFTEVVGGCNCHDDPYQANGYCELAVHVDRATGRLDFELLPD